MSQTSQCMPAICKWVATVHVNTVSIQGAEIVDRSHSHSLGPVRTEIKGMWLNPRLDQQKMHSHLSEKDTDPTLQKMRSLSHKRHTSGSGSLLERDDHHGYALHRISQEAYGPSM